MTGAVMSVCAIADDVRTGRASAVEIVLAALGRIAARDGAINAFTAVLGERALVQAQAVDAARAAGSDPGSLAGVPFAVKGLFDVEGLPTIAGSRIDAAAFASSAESSAENRAALGLAYSSAPSRT
jgi:1-carboxybiuret hydrolase